MQLSKLINRSRLAALAIILATTMAPNLIADDDTQVWQGELDFGVAMLTLKVEIKEEKQGYSAVAYSVDQGNTKIPVDKVEIANNKIILKLSAVNASFKGTIGKTGKDCNGTFTQHGRDFELKLIRQESDKADSPKLVEFWKGTFEPEKGIKLEMGIKVFRKLDGSLTATLDSYSQGVTDLPVELVKQDDSYQVKYPAANLEYSGTLDESRKRLVGKIKQGSSEHELAFTKANFEEAPKFNRPQTPKAPFPYESLEVNYENPKQSAKLAGTLTLPRGKGPFPVAITISGSGASDRDASHFGHKPFFVIADHLTRQGIAVLRFDDRGRGGSTGDFSGATSADFATDVEAGIEFLKRHPKIDADKIGLIGHSEGGLIAPMVAAERSDVHFIVMLAGTGVNGGVILKSQSTAIMKSGGESEAKLEANRKVHDAILSLVEKNPDVTHDEIKAAGKSLLDSIEDDTTRGLMESSVKQLVAILKSEWVRYFVSHDPAKTLANVECHVLAMNGEKDLQVLCDLNMNPIERALQQGSPASFKIVRLPNTNHVFQETDGSGSPEDYQTIEQSFSPKALKIIGDWVQKVTR